MQASEHITLLLLKRLKNELTSSDQAALSEWEASEPGQAAAVRQMLDTEHLAGLLQEVERAEERAMNRYRSEGILTDVSHLPVHRIHFLKATWFRYAAILLLILGTVTFFYRTNRPQKEMARIPSPQIGPGGNKAVLTLADGSTIVLDSADNGSLAQQGSTRIVKLSNGQLVYNSSSGIDSLPQSGQAGFGEPLGLKAPNPNVAERYNTITTPKGGQYQVLLEDGSKIWLNAASSVTYPVAFTGKERSVKIKGEAYFEIITDKSRPFIVTVNDVRIRVLGTRFNVNAYPEETSLNTTLLEGAVEVSKENTGIVMKPGEQLQWTKSAGFKRIVQADADAAIAWKNGFFSFRHADIQTVMRQLSRWYDIDVQYQGDFTGGQSFSGEIGRSLSLQDVLNGLQLTKIHYRMEGRKLVIVP